MRTRLILLSMLLTAACAFGQVEFLKKPQLPDTEEDHVSRVGLSANGNFLIGGSRYASVWNAATKKPLHTFNYQHTYTPSMSGFATSPDSRQIAITDGNRAIFFFDLASGQAIGKIDTEHTVAHPSYFPDGTRLLTFDDRLEGRGLVFDIKDLKKKPEMFRLGVVTPISTAISPDSKAIVAAFNTDCTGDKKPESAIVSLNALTGEEVATTKRRYLSCQGLAFSIDGKQLIASVIVKSTGSNAIVVLEGTTLKELKRIGGDAESKYLTFRQQLCYTSGPFGELVAVTDDNHDNCQIWDLATGKIAANLTGSSFYSIAFSADGTNLYAGSRSPKLAIWDLQAVLAKVSPLTALELAPYIRNGIVDPGMIAIAPGNGTVLFSDAGQLFQMKLTRGAEPETIISNRTRLPGSNDTVSRVGPPKFSRDGKLLAFYCRDEHHTRLIVLDRTTKRVVFASTPHQFNVDEYYGNYEFSADSKSLFVHNRGAGFDDKWAKAIPERHMVAFDTSNWRVKGLWPLPEIDNSHCLRLFHDGRGLAIGLGLFRFADRKWVPTEKAGFDHAVVTADSKYVVAHSSTLALWSVDDEEVTEPFIGHQGPHPGRYIRDIAMSQTNVLAVASDKGVQLWRIPEAKLITSLSDVDTNSVAISDDGSVVVAATREPVKLMCWMLVTK